MNVAKFPSCIPRLRAVFPHEDVDVHCPAATRLAFAILFGIIFEFWDAMIFLKILHNIHNCRNRYPTTNNSFLIFVCHDLKFPNFFNIIAASMVEQPVRKPY